MSSASKPKLKSCRSTGVNEMARVHHRLNRFNPCVVVLYLSFLGLFCQSVAASPENPTRAELLQTVKHIQSLAIETQQELDKEKQAHSQTQAALTAAQQAAADTQNQFQSYQAAAEAQIKKGNDAIAQLNSVIKKLHRAKWILCGIWILCVGLAVAKAPLAIKQYALYAGIGLVAAGCAFIWWWI